MHTRRLALHSHLFALLVSIAVACIVCGCSANTADTTTEESPTPQNDTSVQTVGEYTQNMTDEAATTLESELGAFEITAMQRELAAENEAGYKPLDAGRGNPNWINSKSRYAFTRLMDFATEECQRTYEDGDIAGVGNVEGISERLTAAMDPTDEIDRFLLDAVDYCVTDLGIDRDELLKEFTDGIIGDNYPSPSRCLTHTEKIINAYLQSTLYRGEDLKDETDLFLTEGGSAAMSYIFDSLNHSGVLKSGDKIAIATPIFTPYLQIPSVNDYGLVSVNVVSTEENDWDMDPSELEKLKDPEVKALFMVNPSNPASHAISDRSLDLLKEVVEANPNLIILTDDVYGTFVDDFKTVYSVVPHNTILVYSFSKLYGSTGWRLGAVAMHKDNVVDRIISELPDDERLPVEEQYRIVTDDPAHFKFIERLCADSRSIGLYHTSGLSTPSQIMMDLFALTHLVTGDNDSYIEQSKAIVEERYKTLVESLGLEMDDTKSNDKYYKVIDLNDLIAKNYGEDFLAWKKENIDDLQLLNDLASKEGVVLMYGPGFDAPEGYVRISLANLNKEDYAEIARRLTELLDSYYETYQSEQLENAA